ncbi:hypothetical protein GLS40_03595 [Pseudooceanicola sp. 216_PA32_1]|uniref:Uncharacterized protein n=1 Tax=Pseudooceanicola pacificus TaxID=2676438 RepID=A0A844W2Q1_9RHOB|nr:hypothetical protein [Pseudooceanicola pacificus]MWB77101.1 hypothetical protein [Pseudooceanicola pacificus]
MAVSFRILPQHGLVHVRFSGQVILSDSSTALQRFAAHPEFRPGLNQLIDLTDVTGHIADPVELFRVHARKAEVFNRPGEQNLTVYIAPHETAQKLVALILRSFEGIEGLRHSVVRAEAEAMDVLGFAQRSVAELTEQPV